MGAAGGPASEGMCTLRDLALCAVVSLLTPCGDEM